MKCCFCNRGMDEGVSLIPIEPKGTKNRKWACLDCKPNDISIPGEVKEICSVFDEKFKQV